MRVIQYVDKAGVKAVGIVEGGVVAKVATHRSTYDAALAAIAKGVTLAALLDADRAGTVEDYDAIIAEKRIRLPNAGDIHVHFLGAPLLSFSSGFHAQPGDVFEVSAEGFGRPLRNKLTTDPEKPVVIHSL